MRILLSAVLFFIPYILFSQDNSVSGTVINSEDNFPFPGVIVKLMKDDKVIKEVRSDYNGSFKIVVDDKGIYNLRFTYLLMKDKLISNILIDKDVILSEVVFPDPCIITKPICPHNHDDNIIPIEYGLPTAKMEKKAKKGKIKLGGCEPSPCENWHCKIHDLNF